MATDVELAEATGESVFETEVGRQVFAWRLEQLLRAGYGDATAVALALNGDIDLHTAVDLVSCGCSPDMAARILL